MTWKIRKYPWRRRIQEGLRPHYKCSWDEVINSHKINKVMRYSVTHEIAVTREIVSSLKFNMSNDSDL